MRKENRWRVKPKGRKRMKRGERENRGNERNQIPSIDVCFHPYPILLPDPLPHPLLAILFVCPDPPLASDLALHSSLQLSFFCRVTLSVVPLPPPYCSYPSHLVLFSLTYYASGESFFLPFGLLFSEVSFLGDGP